MAIVVVGAASGIGLSLLVSLRELGVEVFALDTKPAPKRVGPTTTWIQCDLTQAKSLIRADSLIRAKIDGLALIAGVAERRWPGEALRINYQGHRFLTEMLLAKMGVGSSVLSVSSISASGNMIPKERLKTLLKSVSANSIEELVGTFELSPWDEYRLSKKLLADWTLQLAAEQTQMWWLSEWSRKRLSLS
ncbi:NAD-dependent epimerase/dehydratase family protein [Pseudarthrobacter sp902506025]|uniref:NAD(P)-dependent dehydrogenase (Short-subunit alcohol dehydrogenase family) n=1 Tax=Pseudarthrobacter defluvii TaxID=410837 RepID=A0ABT9UPZ9_9MICC|nr:NAD-dependent epimerase/dehydratase family protein [Pseudarthrobacter defluvii]MDQ0121043.1 NAD(P)-dependent dehydrogenase (short-subunit alcohol dehydrogenase family) [Pseudarthrobacter defluvii]